MHRIHPPRSHTIVSTHITRDDDPLASGCVFVVVHTHRVDLTKNSPQSVSPHHDAQEHQHQRVNDQSLHFGDASRCFRFWQRRAENGRERTALQHLRCPPPRRRHSREKGFEGIRVGVPDSCVSRPALVDPFFAFQPISPDIASTPLKIVGRHGDLSITAV